VAITIKTVFVSAALKCLSCYV